VTQLLNIEKCVRNLRDVNLFRGLDDKRLAAVAEHCEFVEISADEYLIREGAKAEHLYVLLTGEIAVSKQLSLPHLSSLQHTDRILSRLTGEGHPVLGETALLGEPVRRSTVRCTADSALYRIDAEGLRRLTEQDAEIGHRVFAHLSEMLLERLQAANNDVVKLSAALVFALEE